MSSDSAKETDSGGAIMNSSGPRVYSANNLAMRFGARKVKMPGIVLSWAAHRQAAGNDATT